MDIVKQYGASLGIDLQPKTVFVEGTSDVLLFQLAARKLKESRSVDILSGFALLAAGEGDRGGTQGVLNQLIVLRGLSEQLVDANGNPIYKMIGLLDNDKAGQSAIKAGRAFSLLEYRDLFRIRQIMPSTGGRDPKSLERSFEAKNLKFKGLNWELEDLVGASLINMFLEEYPTSLIKEYSTEGAIHREFTRDGKSKLIRFCKEYADLDNLQGVIHVLHAIRHFINIPKVQ
ncbi:hypothetical protein [Pseudomonas qingdaonensis]|uniref:hypothetical protein n=1 Tax=Pseudomonas qingdaonensis TaxID=2056231 RepID=UPI002E1923E2|nr:hypothetical protein [Pseudomonas qingdaonensis]